MFRKQLLFLTFVISMYGNLCFRGVVWTAKVINNDHLKKANKSITVIFSTKKKNMNSIHCSCNEKRGAGDIVMSERSIVTEADVDKEKL